MMKGLKFSYSDYGYLAYAVSLMGQNMATVLISWLCKSQLLAELTLGHTSFREW